MSAARLIEHLLLHREIPDWYAPDALRGQSLHAMNRLVAATRAGVQGIDWAILVRQCLRRLPDHEVVRIPRLDSVRAQLLERVDVVQNLDGSLQASPYRPDWVFGLGEAALDFPTERRQSARNAFAAEPWLRRLVGKTSWKSPAQKDATWAALNAPDNSTLLIGLPTGSGKSLVYQCCAAFNSGLTVLVVPTVALGIDQLAALGEFASSPQLKPAFYTTDASAQSVLDSVEARRCRLLITSPEAIVNGRLRSILERHATEGHLQHVVIDEAHLIESWGADFRVEFQLLGAMLRHWRTLSPKGVRALLLSATFSPQAPKILNRLFAFEGAVWEEHVIQRLRPEIHYFTAAAWSSLDDQTSRIVEALHRVPRPVILYVTKKARAEEFRRLLTEQGFQRMCVFHGDTPGTKRQQILDEWRKDRLDLVVATSAFGMGVDKQDVKAVIHACLPEGIDRFYQEVGRGGRDGSATISLLVPGGQDDRVAESMGPTLLADPKKIQNRWNAMWRSRECSEDNCFIIPTGEAPSHLIASETYDESVRWNKRLLLLMERARLLEIMGLMSRTVDDGLSYIEYATVRLNRGALDLENDLAQLLQEQRAAELRAVADSLRHLHQYFRRDQPICRVLRGHFGDLTKRSCGSCSFCRLGRADPMPARQLDFHNPHQKTRPIVQLIEVPTGTGKELTLRLVEMVRRLLKLGAVRRFVVASKHRSLVEGIFTRAENQLTGPYRIDAIEDAGELDIKAQERVVVFHFQTIDPLTAPLNHKGSLIAHWQLGGEIENPPGRWPFMHEVSARPFPGSSALDHWIEDLERRVNSGR
jgi:ATP-dependent DNA helicase RecQ